ncbi:MAG TPA: hypothetical protein VGF55_27995 [Gemmataceae bacterium]|jgi:hypothetical protein
MPALLAAIRARPGMYLGQKSAHNLLLFLYGFRFAEDIHGLPPEARIGGFDRDTFELWVQCRYNPQRLSHNSLSLAAHVAGAEDAGFDLWFRWYDEFAASPRPVRAIQVPLRDGTSVPAVVTEICEQSAGTGAAAEVARWQCPCGSWMDAETDIVAWFDMPRGFGTRCSSCNRRYAILVEAGRCVSVREVDPGSGQGQTSA